jgi:hypothetical protein
VPAEARNIIAAGRRGRNREAGEPAAGTVPWPGRTWATYDVLETWRSAQGLPDLLRPRRQSRNNSRSLAYGVGPTTNGLARFDGGVTTLSELTHGERPGTWLARPGPHSTSLNSRTRRGGRRGGEGGGATQTGAGVAWVATQGKGRIGLGREKRATFRRPSRRTPDRRKNKRLAGTAHRCGSRERLWRPGDADGWDSTPSAHP